MKNKCEHKNFFAQVNVARIEDVQPMRFFADIEIKCSECNTPFHFIGVDEFGFSPDRPSLNADSLKICLPIKEGEADFIPAKLSYTTIS